MGPKKERGRSGPDESFQEPVLRVADALRRRVRAGAEHRTFQRLEERPRDGHGVTLEVKFARFATLLEHTPEPSLIRLDVGAHAVLHRLGQREEVGREAPAEAEPATASEGLHERIAVAVELPAGIRPRGVDLGHGLEEPFVIALHELAAHCAVVLVRHLTKEQKRSALHDGMGSVGFASVARSVLRLGVDPDQEDVGAMFHVKCSYARLGRPLGFEKREVGCAGALCWKGPTALTLDIVRSGRPKPGIAEQRALDLDAHLRAHGPQLTRVLQERLKWTKDALQKTRTDIGAEAWKIEKRQVREEDHDPHAGGSPWLVGRPGQCEDDAVKEYVSNGKLNYIATINRRR